MEAAMKFLVLFAIVASLGGCAEAPAPAQVDANIVVGAIQRAQDKADQVRRLRGNSPAVGLLGAAW
jgi:hypothetical protein